MKACGYSQERLAHDLRVDRTTVGRWIRGENDPQGFLMPRLGRLLEASPRELDKLLRPDSDSGAPSPRGVAAPTTGGDLDDVIRREFLQLMTVTAAATALPAATAVAAADAPSGYRPINDSLWTVYSAAPSKRSVYPLVREQAAALCTALRDARREATRKELCAEAGDLFQLAGEVLFDSSQYTDAAHCYTLAAQAAREAGHADLWACALTRHAFIGLYGDHAYAATVPLLDAARAVAAHGDTQLSTRHWVAAVQAEAYAALGDLDACERALDDAEEVHTVPAPRQSGWLRFDGSRLAEERGTCYVSLGRLDLAEEALTTALRQRLSVRRQGCVHADLAALGALKRDPDQIAAHLGPALEAASHSASGYVARRLRTLRPKLAPFLSHHRVREADDRIAALALTS